MSFIPKPLGKKVMWYKNYLGKIVTTGPKASLTADNVKTRQASIIATLAQIDKAADATATSKKENAIRDQMIAALDKSIQQEVRKMKASGDFSTADDLELGTSSVAKTFDPTTYKPKFKVEVISGALRIVFVKNGVDGVNVYSRLQGQKIFDDLGYSSRTPFEDTRPLAVPGVPEIREIMIRGVIADQEVGQNSDIITVIFGG